MIAVPQSGAAAALCQKGLADLHAGRLPAAETLFEAALRLDAGHFESLWMLAIIQVQTGRPGAALARLDGAIAARPAVAGPHTLRGVALLALGRLDEAIASHDRAVALRPDDFAAHYNRGLALAAAQRREDAVGSFDRAARLNPAAPEPHYNRATVLRALKRPEAALAGFDRAIALDPNLAGPHYNRGLALGDLGRHPEALASYERALHIDPRHAEAHANRALALVDMGRTADSIAGFDQAIALKPDFAEAHHNRAHALLRLGRFEEGWRAYERRASLAARGGGDLMDRPLWTGASDLEGKTLFVRHEQGLGDTLQFMRYLVLAKTRAAKVVVSVQDPLVDLARRLLPGIPVLGDGERPDHFDAVCPLLSLPLAFATTLDTIPPPLPHGPAEPERRARFADRLGPRTRPRVGLAWSGNPAHGNDHRRSIPFEAFAPLLSADVEWVALQKEIRPSDAAAFAASGAVSFHGEALETFSDTAALLELMDLVISVDTSLAHLAGSMAKPVWILLPFVPDWRWLLDRSDSPWYPSARLFRQPRPGDWAGVVDEARRQLAGFVAARDPG